MDTIGLGEGIPDYRPIIGEIILDIMHRQTDRYNSGQGYDITREMIMPLRQDNFVKRLQ